LIRLLVRTIDFIESFEEDEGEESLGWMMGWDVELIREGGWDLLLWKERSLDSSFGFDGWFGKGLGDREGFWIGVGVGLSERTGDEVEHPI
jgi:hypothetical protein